MAVDLSSLTPDTQLVVGPWIADCAAAGIPIVIVSTKRSCAQQNSIYAEGRTAPGTIRTDARGCQSWHVTGRAVDFGFQSGGGSVSQYAKAGALAKARGMEWGGDFKVSGNPDPGHVEYHPGLTISDVCPNPDVCRDDLDTTLVVPTAGGAPGPWFDGGCGAGPRVRLWPDAHIEVEGEGFPKRPLSAWSKGSPKQGVATWQSEVYASSDKWGMPANIIAGIMQIESGGDPTAGSPQGAYGLMQLIPATAKFLAGRVVSKEELAIPSVNIDLGTKLLRQLYDRYQGNVIKMAFAYNAGSAVCGGGVAHDGSGSCFPNRWNLKADCYSAKDGTVDYAIGFIASANQALDTVYPVRRLATSQVPPSSSRSGSPVLVGTLFGVAAGALFFLARK